LERGGEDVNGFRALTKSLQQQHRGTKIHSRFMKPSCSLISTPRVVNDSNKAFGKENERDNKGLVEPPPTHVGRTCFERCSRIGVADKQINGVEEKSPKRSTTGLTVQKTKTKSRSVSPGKRANMNTTEIGDSLDPTSQEQMDIQLEDLKDQRKKEAVR
jgi:hypothetical protein